MADKLKLGDSAERVAFDLMKEIIERDNTVDPTRGTLLALYAQCRLVVLGNDPNTAAQK